MRTIIACFIIIVLSSCTFHNKVDIEIVAVSTPIHESVDYIGFVRYEYEIRNNSDIPISIHYSQIDKIFDPRVEGLNPTDIPVLANLFLLFEKDTIWGTPGYGRRFEAYDTTLHKSKHFNGLFELNWMLLSQLYETKYENLYEREKDFILDVIKEGVLCVVIQDSIYKIKNTKPLEYMPDGVEE
jgi:hypothetical protein